MFQLHIYILLASLSYLYHRSIFLLSMVLYNVCSRFIRFSTVQKSQARDFHNLLHLKLVLLYDRLLPSLIQWAIFVLSPQYFPLLFLRQQTIPFIALEAPASNRLQLLPVVAGIVAFFTACTGAMTFVTGSSPLLPWSVPPNNHSTPPDWLHLLEYPRTSHHFLNWIPSLVELKGREWIATWALDFLPCAKDGNAQLANTTYGHSFPQILL